MYYTIRQMAELFGVTEHTLRFYTDKGLLPCTRDGGNRRVFNEESVNWMQGVHRGHSGILSPVPAGGIRGESALAVRHHPQAAGGSLQAAGGSQSHCEIYGG